jgi:hypothetical protein
LKITAPHIASRDDQEYDTGHGKLSARLDLRQAQDLDTLKGLVREGDVFSQGYRPGTLANRGLSPEELAAVRPGIVYVSLCAFSHKGPWASRRGFDTVVQNVSGITTRQGELFPGPEPGPQFYPVSAIDYLTGYLMAFGAMVALARRAREGGSWLVRISLAQTGRWLVGLGEVPEAALKNVPKEFPQADIDRWSIETDTPAGRLRHLGPTVGLSETPPYWGPPLGPARLQRARLARPRRVTAEAAPPLSRLAASSMIAKPATGPSGRCCRAERTSASERGGGIIGHREPDYREPVELGRWDRSRPRRSKISLTVTSPSAPARARA